MIQYQLQYSTYILCVYTPFTGQHTGVMCTSLSSQLIEDYVKESPHLLEVEEAWHDIAKYVTHQLIPAVGW